MLTIVRVVILGLVILILEWDLKKRFIRSVRFIILESIKTSSKILKNYSKTKASPIPYLGLFLPLDFFPGISNEIWSQKGKKMKR